MLDSNPDSKVEHAVGRQMKRIGIAVALTTSLVFSVNAAGDQPSPKKSKAGDGRVQLYRDGCEAGVAEACYNLGVMKARGQGVFKNAEKAGRLFRIACEGGVMLGCSNLGSMYKYGEGVPKDIAKAVQLFRKACVGGNQFACRKVK